MMAYSVLDAKCMIRQYTSDEQEYSKHENHTIDSQTTR